MVIGRPEWTVDDVTETRGPRSAILHASNAVHAMRATNEPLLAIYSWTGDLQTASICA